MTFATGRKRLPFNIVVPDFNVCTNTITGYKPHRIVKDSHLKDAVVFTAFHITYKNNRTIAHPTIIIKDDITSANVSTLNFL